MNTQRREACDKLIQDLFTCPSGQEDELLQANSSLLEETLAYLNETANDFRQQGKNNQAQSLDNIAKKISNFLSVGVKPSNQNRGNFDPKYEQFLTEIIKVVRASQGNRQVVYPLLQQNLDKLDENLPQVLRNWATEKLANTENQEEKTFIAGCIGEFGNLIQEFPLGSKLQNMETAIICYEITASIFTFQTLPQVWAMTQNNLATAYLYRIKGSASDNLEKSIKCYQAALTVYKRKAFPQQWASTQNNLANAYWKRIKGSASDNLEKSIKCYQAALTVYKRKAFPQEWAMTQNNLAAAYSKRIKGSASDNLEKSIECSLAALTVRTRNAFPQDWASTQNNLGEAYTNRIKGSASDNLEQAIKCYQAALTVRTRHAFPQDWAMTQNNLAIAYSDRINGSKADNLENSIECYQAALTVYTPDAFPQEWAQTQNNLANAYLYRIKGSASDNLEMSIECYEDALTVYKRKAFPQQWAITQNNLAIAYRDRIKGSASDNLEMSIECSLAALTVLTPGAFPQEWAMTQNNLGLAYRDRIKGSASDNLEMSIECYEDALTVYKRKAFPQEWAMTQNNLANAYLYRIKGSASDNLEMSIECYQAALTVYTREAFPQDWAQTQNNLANAYLYRRIKGSAYDNLEMSIKCYQAALTVRTRDAFPQDNADTLFNLGVLYQDQQKNWQKAYETFAEAIETVEFLRGDNIASDDETKQKLSEEWNQLYLRMVEVCIELKLYQEAVEYADRSKNRNLTELLSVKDLYPRGQVPPEIVSELQRLRQAIDEEKRRLKLEGDNNYAPLNQLRQEFARKYPYQPLEFNQIQQLVDEKTALVEWYLLSDRFCAFILTGDNLSIWRSSPADAEKLQEWANNYLQQYYTDSENWRQNLASEVEKLAQILHIDEIVKNIPENCDKLVLIPHRFLHLFPLHALPVTAKKGENQNEEKIGKTNYLIDLFTEGLSYAPSCQLLHQIRQKTKPQINKFFALQNPSQAGGRLYYADIEVDKIRQLFSGYETTVLKHDQATKTACQNALKSPHHIINFSCHGYFNLEEPLKSALMLAGSKLIPAPDEDNPDRYLKAPDNSSAIDLEKCLTLEDIFQLDLTHCSLVTLSACETGLTDPTNSSDEYIGMPSAFLLAGSSTLVQSLWSVSDFSTAFLLIKFYENLIQHKLPMVLALNQAQIWLRNVSKNDFIDWVKGLGLPQKQFEEIKNEVEYYDDDPFADPQYWASFCLSGKTAALGD